jgi:hypothetical protein
MGDVFRISIDADGDVRPREPIREDLRFSHDASAVGRFQCYRGYEMWGEIRHLPAGWNIRNVPHQVREEGRSHVAEIQTATGETQSNVGVGEGMHAQGLTCRTKHGGQTVIRNVPSLLTEMPLCSSKMHRH